MSEILQKAFDKAAQLPPEEQDAFGAWMLAELESEERWDELFRRSPELLEKMADEALTEHRAGKTLPLDPDTL
jgi:hypothetical protein